MGKAQAAAGHKLERRVIEKNRRHYMKDLYSQLNSLLPNQHYSEPLSLPEQIDEAINYIKNLESNMQKLKQKRDHLMLGRRKRPYELCSTSSSTTSETRSSSPANKSPQIEVHEIGTLLEVVLTTGLHNQSFLFYDIIRILDQELADVVHASFSSSGDTIVYLVRAEVNTQMGILMHDFGAEKIADKLKRVVYGSPSNVNEELQLQHYHDDQDYLWDFQIHPQIWEF